MYCRTWATVWTIEGLEKLRSRGPVFCFTMVLVSLGLADAERVGDFVQGCPLSHVLPASAEPNIPVEVTVRCLNTGGVLGSYGLVRTSSELRISCYCFGHSGCDLGVGIRLVRGGVRGLLQLPGDDRSA
jgi:hypothetical protein